MRNPIQLHVPEPCHENWNAMTPQDQGRFCNACAKVVVDFTTMSDKEVLDYISTASGGVCGRFQNDQLNRGIKVPESHQRFSFKYFWGLMITSLLVNFRLNGQVKPLLTKIDSTPPALMSTNLGKIVVLGRINPAVQHVLVNHKITGRVIDEAGQAISYASVMLGDKGTAANEQGYFNLVIDAEGIFQNLRISAVGFEEKVVSVSGNTSQLHTNKKSIEINAGDIELKSAVMGEVVVTACDAAVKGKLSYTTCSTTVGAAFLKGQRITGFQKIKDTLIAPFVYTGLKAFPNPIRQNMGFNIIIKTKNKGMHNIRFIDAGGKLMYQEQLNVLYDNQVENFNGNIFTSGGVYFAIISNSKSKDLQQIKLLVQ